MSYVPSAWEPEPTHDVCVYCDSAENVYQGRCEPCAVVEYDRERRRSAEALAVLREHLARSAS